MRSHCQATAAIRHIQLGVSISRNISKVHNFSVDLRCTVIDKLLEITKRVNQSLDGLKAHFNDVLVVARAKIPTTAWLKLDPSGYHSAVQGAEACQVAGSLGAGAGLERGLAVAVLLHL